MTQIHCMSSSSSRDGCRTALPTFGPSQDLSHRPA